MSKELIETQSPDSNSAPVRRHLMRDFDRLFDRMSSAIELPAIERIVERAGVQNGFAPAIDIVETDGEYKVMAEVPGLEPSQVDVSVASNMLVIKGEKSRENERTEGGAHISERTFGSFRRSFLLPDDVDAGQIEANHRHGVLTIRLPKTKEAKQLKKIEIKAEA
ncbi:Hsp20/alpha crystallin family protein [Methylopila sp. Yamaguchi]|uniref:Hsp20/alpha crystallin family protein n=1 Tax=Methylopila sp. Yamaguchi TaxID=1437817 RepID=UPI000CAE60F9|nr:Hsp20/alpha crystallin family protein [Methylopila sp. Yamaguchi]GBD47811.1 heat shock protein Hsp20 [Methylopila sp. Yamaguchi]